MKRCPECRRDYLDDSLSYCLEDGSPLVQGVVAPLAGGIHSTEPPPSGSATLVLHSTEHPSAEPGTRLFDDNASGSKDNSNAVAVLPFVNLSRNEDHEYFSDGLAEELLNVLSKISGLRVAARTSAFAFKGKQASVEEIGKALHVQSVLEGSVRVAGELVRIAVQLVDVGSGYHLWSETYDRRMDDIFAIQDDIAHSVVGQLRERLQGPNTDRNLRESVVDEVAKAIKGRTADPEAHRLMLLGRHLLDRVNEADAIKAIGYFRQALDIDPDYALCWAQLGRAFYIASIIVWSALETDVEQAEMASRRAIALDPDLAEAHALLARVRLFRNGDFIGAQQYCRRALDLAPENIDTLLGAANIAGELGQYERALDHCRRATTIDPLSPWTWAATADINFLAGNLSEAESAARRTLELAPQRVLTRACLGLIVLGQGRPDEALAEALLEPETSGWRPWSLTIVHHAAGRSSESDLELATLKAKFGADAAFQIAEAHSMRGETDEAFEWLERAIDRRDPGSLGAKVSPLLKPLRDDPRWEPLMKKIGYPDQSG